MRKLVVPPILSLLSTAVMAETIVFEADTDILVIRGFETAMGWVQYDILGSRDGTVLCVAIDSDGKPLATSTGFVEAGYVAFVEIKLAEIDKVACRYN